MRQIRRILETLVGLSLIATAIVLLLRGHEHADWLYLALVGFGGFFVSKSLAVEALKTIASTLGIRKDG